MPTGHDVEAGQRASGANSGSDGKRAEARELGREAAPSVARVEWLKRIAKSIADRMPVLIADGIGWAQAQRIRAQFDSVGCASVYQAGYGPSEQTDYCPIHRYYHGGIRGCHVCRGFCVE
jgi:hypothetical protein